jgi:Na+-translocating ferredoxin:NAD+ oxidoreductase RnfA subunit
MANVNYLKQLNPILAIVAIVQFLSGMFSKFIPYEIFKVLHTTNGILFSIIVAIHIYLNWKWVQNTYFKKKDQ